MLLERRRFVVKERVGLLKLADTYDILDPETGQTLGEVRDEPTSLARFARLLVNKSFLATTINVYEAGSSRPVASLNKRPGFLRTTVIVTGPGGVALGSFRSKAISLGGAFFVLDPSGQTVAEIKGDWKGWNFRFLDSAGRELGTVTKKWAGIGKELFTSADTYLIALSDAAPSGANQVALLLAAGLAIDVVFKERK